jgi:hypothetical protein
LSDAAVCLSKASLSSRHSPILLTAFSVSVFSLPYLQRGATETTLAGAEAVRLRKLGCRRNCIRMLYLEYVPQLEDIRLI